MIRANRLTKKFDDIAAIDEPHARCCRGRDLRPVGPDGAGKTTTMRLLTSIMDPDRRRGLGGRHHVVREAEAVKEEHRLHEPAVRALSRSDGDGEPRLLRRHLQRAPPRPRRSRVERLLAFSNLTPFKRRLAGNLVRRNEAEARAGLRADPHAARCSSSTSRPTASIPSRAATSGGSSTNCCGRR